MILGCSFRLRVKLNNIITLKTSELAESEFMTGRKTNNYIYPTFFTDKSLYQRHMPVHMATHKLI